MPVRLLTFLTVFSLITLEASAQDPARQRARRGPQNLSPSLIVRVKSINDLIEDGMYLAKMAGHENKSKEVRGFLDSMTGEKGLQGIDMKRPIGIYGAISPDLVGSGGAVLVPIADEKTFLEMLENFNVKAEKGNDDIYTVTVSALPIPVPIYARFANQYVYITAQTKDALAKNRLLDPAKILSGGRNAMVSAMFRIDQIPGNVKQIAVGGMELKLAEEKDKEPPGETPANKELRVKMIDAIAKKMTTLINEGGQLELFFDVNRKTSEIVGEVSLSGKAGSELAQAIADLGQSQSLFGGMIGASSAISFLAHGALPADILDPLEKALAEGFQAHLKNLKDASKRELAKKLYQALEPTIKAGQLDLGFAMNGPSADNTYGFLVGIKVKDGKEIEKLVPAAVNEMPEKDRGLVALNVDKAGDVAIHRLDVQSHFDEGTRKGLGNNPLFFAFRDNALLISGGANGLEALKDAIPSESMATPALSFSASLTKLGPLMAKGNKEGLLEFKKIVESSFKGDQGSDRVRFTVEGGKSLKASFTMKAAAINFFAQVGESQHLNDKDKPPNKKKTATKTEDDK